MSVVTIAEAWPAAGQPFTVADLDRMPDDGRRYELLDGMLAVSPRPTTTHQLVAMRMLLALSEACPEGLCVIPEPAVQLTPQTEFDPDIVVVRMEEIGGAKFTAPPLLIVELRSPSTALIDLNSKKAAYERFGVPSYWIVVPDLSMPSLTVFELYDGTYQQAAQVYGSEPFRAERPYPVEIVPARLVRGIASPGSQPLRRR
jgi:Uma2 family endonuclease